MVGDVIAGLRQPWYLDAVRNTHATAFFSTTQVIFTASHTCRFMRANVQLAAR